MEPRRVPALVAVAVTVLANFGVAACSADPDADPGAADTPRAAPAEPSPSRDATPTTPSAGPSGEASGGPAFAATVSRISPDVRSRIRYTHRAACPVALDDLRYLQLGFVRFDGTTGTGEMVVHADQARAVVSVFRRLYDARWPIRRMRLVDDYRGDDDRSMAADNSSAYNCRRVGGGTEWSEHAYGRAIDLNPVENPFVTDTAVVPPAGRRFARIGRSADADVPRGAIRADDVVVSAFARIGWEWGGEWTSSRDFQHFSYTGR